MCVCVCVCVCDVMVILRIMSSVTMHVCNSGVKLMSCLCMYSGPQDYEFSDHVGVG